MPHIKKMDDPFTFPVIVITKHKGVIFGYMRQQDVESTRFPMMRTKVAIEWGTTKGINELADTGPTAKSLISAEADAPMVHGVIKILNVKRESEEAWRKA